MKIKILIASALVFLMSACSIVAPSVDLKDGADKVVVSDKKPDGAYELVIPVSVSHGKGCRDFGYLGTRDEAIKALKNKTVELRGDYAQITQETEPHLDGGCYVNKYELMALIYRKASPSTQSAQAQTQTQATPAPAKVELSDEEPFTKKMRELKALKDDGIITQEEFDTQRSKLLEQGFNTK
jgi:DUF971 family protein